MGATWVFWSMNCTCRWPLYCLTFFTSVLWWILHIFLSLSFTLIGICSYFTLEFCCSFHVWVGKLQWVLSKKAQDVKEGKQLFLVVTLSSWPRVFKTHKTVSFSLDCMGASPQKNSVPQQYSWNYCVRVLYLVAPQHLSSRVVKLL